MSFVSGSALARTKVNFQFQQEITATAATAALVEEQTKKQRNKKMSQQSAASKKKSDKNFHVLGMQWSSYVSPDAMLYRNYVASSCNSIPDDQAQDGDADADHRDDEYIQNSVDEEINNANSVKGLSVVKSFIDDSAVSDDNTSGGIPDVAVAVSSRKIKNTDTSPSDILFRTHHYDFKMVPNDKFFEFCGRRNGFFVELKILKQDREQKPSRARRGENCLNLHKQ